MGHLVDQYQKLPEVTKVCAKYIYEEKLMQTFKSKFDGELRTGLELGYEENPTFYGLQAAKILTMNFK